MNTSLASAVKRAGGQRRFVIRSISRRCVCYALLGLGLLVAPLARPVQVGPEAPAAEPGAEEQRAEAGRLMPVPLRIAVPVLDPGYSANDKKLQEKGIWPEVRNSEAIWFALKIQEALIASNQFDSVLVTPDAAASADFYLLAAIKESTGEILKLRYQLVDATGKSWFTRTVKHRVEIGWHERFGEPGRDPFNVVYRRIAASVQNALGPLARDHAQVAKRNQTLIVQGRAPRLSRVERIHAVRELVVAEYFAPDLYGEAVSQSNRSASAIRRITYLPDRSDGAWTRIKAMQGRDDRFLEALDQQYQGFGDRLGPTYEDWQKEMLPIAREIRLAKRSETLAFVGAALVGAATIAEATTNGTSEVAVAAGALVASGLLVKGMMDRARKKREMAVFEEMSRSYHDTFKPMRVEVSGNTTALAGTAQTQYAAWRTLLAEIYRTGETDPESIRIVEPERDAPLTARASAAG